MFLIVLCHDGHIRCCLSILLRNCGTKFGYSLSQYFFVNLYLPRYYSTKLQVDSDLCCHTRSALSIFDIYISFVSTGLRSGGAKFNRSRTSLCHCYSVPGLILVSQYFRRLCLSSLTFLSQIHVDLQPCIFIAMARPSVPRDRFYSLLSRVTKEECIWCGYSFTGTHISGLVIPWMDVVVKFICPTGTPLSALSNDMETSDKIYDVIEVVFMVPFLSLRWFRWKTIVFITTIHLKRFVAFIPSLWSPSPFTFFFLLGCCFCLFRSPSCLIHIFGLH